MGESTGRKPPGRRCHAALFGCPCLIAVVAALAALSTVLPVGATPTYDYPQTQLASSASDYPDYQMGVRYDEYPVVVPKRAALLIDKLMVALQRAYDEEKGASRGGMANEKSVNDNEKVKKKDLQRREQQKGRVYWRCYFNAVSCFKRK